MPDFIFRLPDIYVFLIVSFILVSLSIITICVLKRYLPLELRYRENQTIGNISAVIGVIYGVLAGLTALYLFNNNGYATEAAQHEASAVADLYRDSKWLQEPARSRIQTEIKLYLDEVIKTEWPLMKQGAEINHDGDTIIEKISNELNNYKVTTNTELLIFRDILDDIRTLYDAREERINMSSSELSPEIWIVILIGTILTIGINFLFGMHFYLHLMTVSATALMASSMIFLLVTLDRPFQGQFVVGPDAFQSVQNFIQKTPPSLNVQGVP